MIAEEDWLIHHDNAPAHTFCKRSNFWPLKTWLWYPPFLLVWFRPSWFIIVSENQIVNAKALFPGCAENSTTIADCSIRHFKKKVSFSGDCSGGRHAGSLALAPTGTAKTDKCMRVFLYRLGSRSCGHALVHRCYSVIQILFVIFFLDRADT